MAEREVYLTTHDGEYAAPVAYADALAAKGSEIIKRGRKWVYFRYTGNWFRIAEPPSLGGVGLIVPMALLLSPRAIAVLSDA